MHKLNSSKDYFCEVVEPNYTEFMNTASSFRTAFNMSSSLFSMRDWVYRMNKADAERAMGSTFNNETEFWKEIEARCPEAAFIRDLANASKHVTLTKHPSTGMRHIANTYITSVSFGSGDYGVGRYSAPSVLMEEHGKEISLDACATAMFTFWNGLMAQFP